MCYPKPGPRCSRHARTRLAKAQAYLRDAPEVNKREAKEQFRIALEDYYLSPAGLRELEDRGYVRKHERFVKLRRQRLALYRQTIISEASATGTPVSRLYAMLADKNTPKEARVVIAERLAATHPVWRAFPKELAVGQLLGKRVPQ